VSGDGPGRKRIGRNPGDASGRRRRGRRRRRRRRRRAEYVNGSRVAHRVDRPPFRNAAPLHDASGRANARALGSTASSHRPRQPPNGSTMHAARSSPASARVTTSGAGTRPLLRLEGARLRPEAAMLPPRASFARPHECLRWTQEVLRPVEAAGLRTQGSKAVAGRRSASTGKQRIVGSRAPCPAMGRRCFKRMMHGDPPTGGTRSRSQRALTSAAAALRSLRDARLPCSEDRADNAAGSRAPARPHRSHLPTGYGTRCAKRQRLRCAHRTDGCA
jgi:hypothetical protein